MNEDQVTTLLDRLARDVEVSHPPVAATADAGRRRLRWRHRAQVGGAAAVVLALAGGGLVLQQQLAAEGQLTNQPSAVTPPLDALVGRWAPVILLKAQSTPPTGVNAAAISFARERDTDRLTWSGNDGCYRVGGAFQLRQHGGFHAWMTSRTQTACLGVQGTLPFSGASAVVAATFVDVTGGRLTLADASGRILGVFVRYHRTQLPLGPRDPAGQPPTKSQLLGSWFPVTLDGKPFTRPPGSGHVSYRVTFRVEARDAPPTTNIAWTGYDGCNWNFGWVHLSQQGVFSTTGNGSTLRGCIGPGQAPYSEVDAITEASQVRLANGRLRLYNTDRDLLAVFRPLPGVIN